jgi:hypothetical protein
MDPDPRNEDTFGDDTFDVPPGDGVEEIALGWEGVVDK